MLCNFINHISWFDQLIANDLYYKVIKCSQKKIKKHFNRIWSLSALTKKADFLYWNQTREKNIDTVYTKRRYNIVNPSETVWGSEKINSQALSVSHSLSPDIYAM